MLSNQYSKNATSKVKKISSDIGTAGVNAVASVQSAADYLGNHIRNDIIGAVNAAQTSFNNIETTFKTNVSGHANDFITFVQGEIDGFVSDAKNDLANLELLQSALVSNLESTIDGIKSDLETAKSKLSAELDAVIAYMKNEVVKLEGRISSVGNAIDSIATRVGIIMIIGAIGFFIFEVVRKDIAAHDRKKAEDAEDARNAKASMIYDESYDQGYTNDQYNTQTTQGTSGTQVNQGTPNAGQATQGTPNATQGKQVSQV